MGTAIRRCGAQFLLRSLGCGVAVTVPRAAVAAICAVLVVLVGCSRPGSHAAGNGPQAFPGVGGYERWRPTPSVPAPSITPLPSTQMPQSAIRLVSTAARGPGRTPDASSPAGVADDRVSGVLP